jgi:hypothetical protein
MKPQKKGTNDVTFLSGVTLSKPQEKNAPKKSMLWSAGKKNQSHEIEST